MSEPRGLVLNLILLVAAIIAPILAIYLGFSDSNLPIFLKYVSRFLGIVTLCNLIFSVAYVVYEDRKNKREREQFERKLNEYTESFNERPKN